jgi:hypothetical protein
MYLHGLYIVLAVRIKLQEGFGNPWHSELSRRTMTRTTNRILLLLACAACAVAQSDLLRVASPHGQLEFRLFVDQPPEPGSLLRPAYQVLYRGKLLIDTSFLGLEIRDQTMLGEKVGLVASNTATTRDYNSLFAEYLQNGSTGRSLNIEVRAYDDRVTFRYLVPRSPLLNDIVIQNEATEFKFAPNVDLPAIGPDYLIPLPFRVEQPGVGRITIGETDAARYPPLYLSRSHGTTLITRFATGTGVRTTPLTSSWRVVSVSPAN